MLKSTNGEVQSGKPKLRVEIMRHQNRNILFFIKTYKEKNYN